MDPPDLSDDLGEVDVADLTDGDEVEDAVVTGEFAGASFDGLTVSGCRFDGVPMTGSSFDGLVLD